MKRILTLIIVTLTLSTASFGQVAKIKALFLYQFAKYTSWPKEDSALPFVITVIGDKEVADQLKASTTGRNVGARAIEVVTTNSVSGLEKSDIIYLGSSKSNKIGELTKDQSGNKVLIVSGVPGQCSQGAAFSFIEEDGKVIYEVSEANINSHG